jgi:hypothetical protein
MGKSGMVAVKELSNIHIENIIDLLKKGLPLSEDYRLTLLKYLEQTQNSLLFDTKPVPAGSKRGKEYELIYADKEQEEDILAEG